jgi:mono/diheme cytochrome c family protein
MILPLRTLAFCTVGLLSFAICPAASPDVGPFFEPDQPFFESQVQVTTKEAATQDYGNFVVRGIVQPFPSGAARVFDQELLRVAGVWRVPAGESPISPDTMAQTSYARPRRKAGAAHPLPTGPLLLTTGAHPGVALDLVALFTDPRPAAREGDSGRGPLPATIARFEGIEVAGETAILNYRVGETLVREWTQSPSIPAVPDARPAGIAAKTADTEPHPLQLFRHFEVGAHSRPIFFAIGAVPGGLWNRQGVHAAFVNTPASGLVRFAANSDAISISVEHDELVATLAPSATPQRFSFALSFSAASSPVADAGTASTDSQTIAPPLLAVNATPALPARAHSRRWPQTASSSVQLKSLSQNGLILDRIAVPETNPWSRRVRAADLAFLDDDRAAVVTYDGDVWIVAGFKNLGAGLTWSRFASGLNEPLAIAAPHGVIQVATKNGVVRLHDRDTTGEADWYENFNDQVVQSRTSRSFPLDMDLGPDGSTYVTQGGIVDQSGIKSGGTGTIHTGAVVKISPDGRTSHTFASAAREPFVTVHPVTGVVTGTDQQGHYIPTSVAYLIRDGDTFGFLQEHPEKLTPPLVWIPHEQDTSSSSQVWIIGQGMGPWNNRLLHLSYGTGRMFLIAPDLTAPVPQGAAIPLDLKTELPLLHARRHPSGNAVYLAGFQIWGTRATTTWGLGRLRVGPAPISTAIGAQSFTDGVILEFATPVDPASLSAKNTIVRAWNYVRSHEYGSGRYTLEGPPGTNALGVGQIIASTDRKSVFVQLPKLPKLSQLELRHDFRSAAGNPLTGVVYLTVNEPRPLDLASVGFPNVDLTKNNVVVTQQREELATSALGKALSESLGCVGCHSADGSTEGKVGPTWKGLYGSTRTFVVGTTETADELYLRAKILDPMKKRVTTGAAEMPSYRGVVSESQLESLVLYIKSLRRPLAGEAKAAPTDGSAER